MSTHNLCFELRNKKNILESSFFNKSSVSYNSTFVQGPVVQN